MARPSLYKTEEERKAAKRVYNAAYHAANKNRIKELAKVWREKNKTKVVKARFAYKSARREKINAQERTRYHATKDAKRNQWRPRWQRNNKRRWQKTLAEQVASLGRPRPEFCEACGGNDGGIVFDHCHTGMHARGWLCDRCNIALGCLKDDPDRLRKLIAYLQRNRDKSAPQLALSGI